ncbi:MAG: hypothetical protein LRY68_07985 [Sulfurospirillum sp.]|nr:hypothetical protein [Sulfurospirillum sp.]
MQKLSQSNDINIYALFAFETLGIPLKNIISPSLQGRHPSFEVSDPFAWTKEINKVYTMNTKEVEAFARSFEYANTLPHYCYLMERATRYSKHYYPIPYAEEIAHYSLHRQALMLAIARQESRFFTFCGFNLVCTRHDAVYAFCRTRYRQKRETR